MNENEIREILKETGAFLQGHFLLSSGKHSDKYVQCAKLLRFPKESEKVISALTEKVRDLNIDVVCGPAMGGVIVSYELGRQLNKESIFTERSDNIMCLRRGFEVHKGQRVLITEDVVTTGKSTLETVKVLEEYGATVVGLGCIVDRRAKENQDFPLPVYSAIKLKIDTYDAEECPLCKEGKIPPVKPGSRKF